MQKISIVKEELNTPQCIKLETEKSYVVFKKQDVILFKLRYER